MSNAFTPAFFKVRKDEGFMGTHATRNVIRKSCVVLIGFVLPALVANAQVLNGGFESGTGASADSWTQFNTAFRTGTNDTGAAITAHSGGYSLKAYGPFGSLYNASGAIQIISSGVSAGQTWVFNGFGLTWSGDPMTNLTTSAAGFGLIQMSFRDASGNPLGSSYDGPHLFAVNSSTNPTPLNTWISCTVTATAPAGTAQVALFALHVGTVNDGGSIFWDDLSAGLIPEPGTMGLVLAGLAGLLVLRKTRRP